MTGSYETPQLVILGEIAELTEGSTTGAADQLDGQGSTEPNDQIGTAG